MKNIAIQIEHVSKQYKLGVINTGTFFRDMQTAIARRQGKPDPHAKIGTSFYEGDDSFWALKDISFDILEGDRIGIIGTNGAGKSTLLKLISRISAPTEGVIRIHGRVASLLEVGTGFHKELTGRENIYLNGSILGMKKRQIDKIIDEIIDFSGIEKHIDTPVKRYSSGMYVRLGFAVAAHLDSEILIADEVLAVGDIKFQQKAIGKMNDISSKQGRTVLFVSHNMQAVQSLCNKGVVLQKGKLIKAGTLDECVLTYNGSNDLQKLTLWEGSNGDQNLQLKKAFLTQIEAGYELTITYNIDLPYLDYVFSVLIFNKDGKQLCFSNLSDFISDNDYKNLCSEGEHTVKLIINTNIFTTGEYYVEFDFAIHNLRRITTPDTRLSFEIFDERNHRHLAPSRENLIEPNWLWEIL